MKIVFSTESGALAIMHYPSKSYMLVLDASGVDRFSTINPQPGVDYDKTGRKVKIVGVDDID